MRWLVACLVACASVAAAKIVIMEPAIVRQCSHAPSWDGVEKCLKKLGKPTVVRDMLGGKLVQLVQPSGDEGFDTGLSLFVPRGNQWKLGGLYEASGQYELLAAVPLTVQKHTGFRIDIGELLRTSVSLDNVTATPAVFAMHRVLLCGGDDWHCANVVVGCDVFVRGGVMWSFHGTLSISDNQVRVTGDRKLAGAMCSVGETQYLGWSQP